MKSIRQSVKRTDPESGFVLLAVLFLVALILIGLAVAAPKVALSIRRDKELELIHRGNQYKRAIQLYYKKFGSYPANIDQLVNTNQVRFLRKRYVDPMTGKDDWKLIYYGQAHIPAMGLFGQPIANTGAVGAGGVGTPIGASPTGTGVASTGSFGSTGSGSSSSFGSSSGSSFGSSSGSGFGSSSGSGFGSSTGSGFGSSSGSGFGSSSGTTGYGTTGSGPTGSGTTDSGGSGFGSSTGTGTGTGFGTGTGTGTGTGGSAFGSSGSTGSTLGGGGPIVGVAIPDTKASIKEYKKQKHYNEWEFVYNPLEDQLQAMGAAGGTQQNLNGATGTGTNGAFGSSSSSGFGSNSGFGSSSGFGSNSGFGGTSGSGSTNGGQPGGSFGGQPSGTMPTNPSPPPQ